MRVDKYPYRCGICKAQFHYEQGFDGHMRKHKLGVLDNKGLTKAEYKKGYWQNELSKQRKEIIKELEKEMGIVFPEKYKRPMPKFKGGGKRGDTNESKNNKKS